MRSRGKEFAVHVLVAEPAVVDPDMGEGWSQ